MDSSLPESDHSREERQTQCHGGGGGAAPAEIDETLIASSYGSALAWFPRIHLCACMVMCVSH